MKTKQEKKEINQKIRKIKGKKARDEKGGNRENFK